MSHTLQDHIKIPDTISPTGKIWIGNGLVLVLIWLLIMLVFFYEWKNIDIIWGALNTLGIFGIFVISGAMAMDVDDWVGIIVFDPFTKKRRVAFAGFWGKTLWEQREREVSLKREVSVNKSSPHRTKDSAKVVILDLLIHARLDTSGTPEDDAENLIKFDSMEEEADMNEIVYAEIVKMFGSHFGVSEIENLGQPDMIQKAVTVDNAANHDRIHELQKIYGAHFAITAKSVNTDEKTRVLMETASRATAFRTAMDNLKSDTDEEQLSVESRRKTALLLDDIAEYSEIGIGLDVHAPDLKNVRHIALMGGVNPTKPSSKGGKKK